MVLESEKLELKEQLDLMIVNLVKGRGRLHQTFLNPEKKLSDREGPGPS